MNKTHARLIAALGGDRWYWSQSLSVVIRVNNLDVQSFQLRKDNTEQNALRFICHRYLGLTEVD